MTMTRNIPRELKRRDRWVCVSEATKRPFSALDGSPASSTDRTTWAAYTEALCALRAGRCDYLGYVFAEGDGMVAVDIDHCFDECGFLTDEAQEAITDCATYTEISKSGDGIHMIGLGDLPFGGANNRKGWEIYKTSRYFILTGNVIGEGELRHMQGAIDAILADHFSDQIEQTKKGDSRGPCIWEPIWDENISKHSISISADYPPISPGSRHLSLVSFCGQWHSAGAAPSAVLAMARQANERFMKPPLPDEEVCQVVSSTTRRR